MNRQGFYNSRAWQSFRRTYIAKAMKDGELICARCGKPITKAYDCILHHKIHLTEDNFRDSSISLNPENVEPLHMKCHNAEHAKGFAYSGERRIYLVYGPPSAPMVEWVRGVANECDLIVNVDEIFKALGTGRSQKLLPQVIAVRNLLIDEVRMRHGRWQDAYIIGGYPARSERERLAESLGAEIIFIPGAENNEPFVKEWYDIYRRTKGNAE